MNTKESRSKIGSTPRTARQKNWQRLCMNVVEDRDRILLELEHLRAENKILKRSLFKLMSGPTPDDLFENKEKYLAMAKESSIDQVIDELKHEVNNDKRRRTTVRSHRGSRRNGPTQRPAKQSD